MQLKSKLTEIVIVMAAITLLSTINSSLSQAETLPLCDSEQAIEMVRGAYEQNGANFKLLDYDNRVELAFDETSAVRKCMGDIVLNAGKKTIGYEITRAKSDPSRFLIQVIDLDDEMVVMLRKVAYEHNKSDEEKAKDAVSVKELETCYRAHENLSFKEVKACQNGKSLVVVLKSKDICNEQSMDSSIGNTSLAEVYQCNGNFVEAEQAREIEAVR